MKKQAAKLAFEKIVKNANLSDDDLLSVLPSDYAFKYANYAEKLLLFHLTAYILDKFANEIYYRDGGQRNMKICGLTKLQHIELHAMYEYFRRHMKSEYKILIKSAVKKAYWNPQAGLSVIQARKNAQSLFISAYLAKSGIARWNPDGEAKIITSNLDKGSLDNIQGGEYFKQVHTDSRTLDYKQS